MVIKIINEGKARVNEAAEDLFSKKKVIFSNQEQDDILWDFVDRENYHDFIEWVEDNYDEVTELDPGPDFEYSSKGKCLGISMIVNVADEGYSDYTVSGKGLKSLISKWNKVKDNPDDDSDDKNYTPGSRVVPYYLFFSDYDTDLTKVTLEDVVDKCNKSLLEEDGKSQSVDTVKSVSVDEVRDLSWTDRFGNDREDYAVIFTVWFNEGWGVAFHMSHLHSKDELNTVLSNIKSW